MSAGCHHDGCADKDWHSLRDLVEPGWRDDASEQGERAESQAAKMANLVLKEAELFHDQHQSPHAKVRVGEHHAVLRCRSKMFSRWMAKRIYDKEGRVPGGDVFSAALRVIEAKAAFDGPRHELYNRVAERDGCFWYDMADTSYRAIRIDENGWEVVERPPILFTRYDHHAPQVEPIAGGDIRLLFDFVPVTEASSQILLLGWLVSCLVPAIPHPIPVIHGPQGSGKSSASSALRRLADPSSLETLSLPRNHTEFVQLLAHHWVCIFDNLDSLSPWQSDLVCRASTGEGFSKRELYSDDDDVIYKFVRCVGLNGINIAATRADLLDRCILIGLERIDACDRLPEEQLKLRFDAARPQIFGGMLDALSKAMALRSSVRLQSLPRMADFAIWGCAISEALGCSTQDFVMAYDENVQHQNSEVLGGHPVAAAVVAFMSGVKDWSGEPSGLLAELERVALSRKINTRDRLWPASASWLTRRLNEVKPNLGDVGIEVDSGHSGRNSISLHNNAVHVVQSAGSAPKSMGGGALRVDGSGDGTDGIANAIPVASTPIVLQDSELGSTDGTDGISRQASAESTLGGRNGEP